MSLILSGTDGLSDVDGSAATPAIRGTDANTGIFFPAADTIAFSEGGVEAMRIDSSGNVGIGTSSPTDRLDIRFASGTGNFKAGVVGGNNIKLYNTTGDLWVSSSDATSDVYLDSLRNVYFRTAGTNQVIVNASGNVGIGTTSPSIADFNASAAVLQGNKSDTNGFFFKATSSNTVAVFGAGNNAAFLYTVDSNTLRFGTNSAERMRLDTSGNLYINTTSLSAVGSRISVKGSSVVWGCGPTSGNDSFFVYNASSVGVYLGNGGTSWSSSSDERIKTAITPFENALDKVCTLRAGTGRYLTDEETVSRSFLIAQDVQAVLPEAVNVQDDEIGTLGLQYTEVIPLLVAAIKEQNQLIQSLTARITALETPAVTPPTGTQA